MKAANFYGNLQCSFTGRWKSTYHNCWQTATGKQKKKQMLRLDNCFFFLKKRKAHPKILALAKPVFLGSSLKGDFSPLVLEIKTQ